MKLETPETCHHGEKDRLMSIDFHPFSNLFATAGGDQDFQYDYDYSDSETELSGFIKIWKYNPQATSSSQRVTFLAGLNGHKQDVNCVRFSSNGQYLGSGSDDKTIKIWEIQQTRVSFSNKFSSKERIIFKDIRTCIGHSNMVCDISWSNCCNFLVSAGMDDKAILWDAKKGTQSISFSHKTRFLHLLDGHKSFIQGVCYDPFKQFIITVGNDKLVKIWELYQQKKSQKLSVIIKHNLKKLKYEDQELPLDPNPFQLQTDINDNISESENQSALSTSKPKEYICFLGQNELPSFVKRPDWSPDGSFFLLPACVYQRTEKDKTEFCVLAYTRFQPERAVCMFRTENKPAICIRFCPKLFKKEKQFSQKIKNLNSLSLFDIPYKLHFAIATVDMVMVFSTESDIPLCAIGNIHYALLTDLSWKGDEAVAVSSSDGFISLCIFEKDDNGVSELGQVYKQEGQINFFKQIIEIEDKKLQEILFKEDFYKDNQHFYKKFGQAVGKEIQQQNLTGQTLGQVEFKAGGGKRIIPVKTSH